MVQKFKTKRSWLTFLGISLYSLGAYITWMEKGIGSLPALVLFALVFCFAMSSGWNDIYIYNDKISFKNYIRFWKKDDTIYFKHIKDFIYTDGSIHYYEIVFYLKNGRKKSFVINNQIDPYELTITLERQGLQQKNV